MRSGLSSDLKGKRQKARPDPIHYFLTRSSGNTPTCVGKTLGTNLEGWDHRKHPHVREEDKHRKSADKQPPETPPRA